MRRLGSLLLNNNNLAAFLALLFVTLHFVGIPTAEFGLIILGLVALEKGAKSGLYVLVWTALPAVAFALLGNLAPLIHFVLIRAMLIWSLALMIRHYRSWTFAIELLAGLGVVLVVIAHWLAPNIHLWWVGQLNAYLKQVSDNMPVELNSTQLTTLVSYIARVATGISYDLMAIFTLTALVCSRLWQMSILSMKTVGQELMSIRVGYTLSASLLICLASALVLKSALALDILPVLLLPYLFAGLSLVHAITQYVTKQQRWMVLILTYCALLAVFYLAASILIVFGFLDGWCDFRKRIHAKLVASR